MAPAVVIAESKSAMTPAHLADKKPGDLAARRQRLVGDIARQRLTFPILAANMMAPMTSLKHGIARVKTLKKHPAPLIGVAAALALAVVLIKPRRLAALGRMAGKATRLISMAMPLVKRFQRRKMRSLPAA